MTQNHFKPFATGANAIVQTQEDYENSTALKEGFRKGLARSNEVNKALRQATSIAAVVAGFTADKSEKDILDNGDIDTLKQHFETAIRTVGATRAAQAQGTADALAATFNPPLKQLASGKTVLVRANEKNLTKTPTFKADENDARPIVKGNNLPLEAGDIAGAGHWLEMQYDSQLDKWVLQNPAKGISPLNGVPVGTVEYFAMEMPPAGYLKADGRAVARETYPDLYTAIGTTFGEGDGETTFNLPDLIDRFAQGSVEPGHKVEAGLPNVTGYFTNVATGGVENTNAAGAFAFDQTLARKAESAQLICGYASFSIDASRSNPKYGASDTVQPPSLTLLPCIKAFDAATNPGLIDITGLANEVDGKLDRVIDSKPVRYVIDAYISNDGNANWYRKWSDGWIEQGGLQNGVGTYGPTTINFPLPFSHSLAYAGASAINIGMSWFSDTSSLATFSASTDVGGAIHNITLTTMTLQKFSAHRWYACGF